MSVEKVGLYFDKRMSRPWIVRWFGESNERGSPRRYSKAFQRKRDAITFQAQKQAELNTGGKRDVIELTLKELCDKFMQSRDHRLRQKTIEIYRKTIKQLFEFFAPTYPIRKIDREKAERFIATRKLIHEHHKRKGKKLSAWGRSQHFRNARAIFNAAVDWEYIKRNPFSRMKQAKPDQKPWYFIKPDTLKSLLSVVPDMRIKAFYSVMYGAGLRYGEALNLLWDGQNIDFERGRINITNRPSTANLPLFLVKDHEARSVPMPRWLVDVLVELQAEASEGCPFVFLSPERWIRVKEKWGKFYRSGRGDEWQNRHLANGLLKKFKRHCQIAGIKTQEKLSFHNLRKSYAQNLADAGTPAPTLKKLMGHASIRTTEEFYLRSTDANEERACQSLDKLMGVNPTDVIVTFKQSEHSQGNQDTSTNSLSGNALGKSG